VLDPSAVECARPRLSQRPGGGRLLAGSRLGARAVWRGCLSPPVAAPRPAWGSDSRRVERSAPRHPERWPGRAGEDGPQGGGDHSLISSASPYAVLMLDSDLRIVYANPAFCRLFGYPVGRLLGQPGCDQPPPMLLCILYACLRLLMSRYGPLTSFPTMSVGRPPAQTPACGTTALGSCPG
jgi:PAS domain-containing protein